MLPSWEGGHGGSRLGAWLSGSYAPSAVPSDETRPYVPARMSQDAEEAHSLLSQQLGVWHVKWC